MTGPSPSLSTLSIAPLSEEYGGYSGPILQAPAVPTDTTIEKRRLDRALVSIDLLENMFVVLNARVAELEEENKRLVEAISIMKEFI